MTGDREGTYTLGHIDLKSKISHWDKMGENRRENQSDHFSPYPFDSRSSAVAISQKKGSASFNLSIKSLQWNGFDNDDHLQIDNGR